MTKLMSSSDLMDVLIDPSDQVYPVIWFPIRFSAVGRGAMSDVLFIRIRFLIRS